MYIFTSTVHQVEKLSENCNFEEKKLVCAILNVVQWRTILTASNTNCPSILETVNFDCYLPYYARYYFLVWPFSRLTCSLVLKLMGCVINFGSIIFLKMCKGNSEIQEDSEVSQVSFRKFGRKKKTLKKNFVEMKRSIY